jgi:hypothetical protein|tara:strand:- start:906 stop:1442 length:537 start_codon:yes stop_codon:yes gene_type:complete
MAELRIVVDHQKIEYEGPFDLKDLVTMIQRFMFERGFDRKLEKDFESDTKTGKEVEWQVANWKKVSDYAKYIFRIRMLVHDYVKVDAEKDKKKVKVGSGRIIIFFDGLLELDYFHKWDSRPFLVFLRSLYDKFIFKFYTERFEQRLTYDMTHLINEVEKIFNLHRHYRVVKITSDHAH